MTFSSKNVCRLVSIRDYKTKNNNVMYFVKVADKVTYDNADFVLDSDFNNPDQLISGKDYQCELVVDGKYSKLQLVPVKG